MAKDPLDRVRLMVPVAPELLKKLQELAKIDGRPLAYFAGMMVGLATGNVGRRSFAKWLGNRITASQSQREYLGMRQVASREKERIQVLIATEIVSEVEALAEVMDCTVVKLAGLLLDHAADAYVFWVKLFASPLAQPFVWLVGGKSSTKKNPEDFPEYEGLPWMSEESNGPRN